MHALGAPMVGPKSPTLVGTASIVARIQTTGDITPYTRSRCEKEAGGRGGGRVGAGRKYDLPRFQLALLSLIT